MPQKHGPESKPLIKLVMALEHASAQNKAPIWRVISNRLKASRRRRPEVNLGKVAKLAKEGQTIAIPGRLLSMGNAPEGNVTIAAASWSASAKMKVEGKKVKLITLEQLVTLNPKGTGVRIIV